MSALCVQCNPDAASGLVACCVLVLFNAGDLKWSGVV